MAERIPDYVIVRNMVHVRNEARDRTLCGTSLAEIVDEPKVATGGFCLVCQEKQQMPGLDLTLAEGL